MEAGPGGPAAVILSRVGSPIKGSRLRRPPSAALDGSAPGVVYGDRAPT